MPDSTHTISHSFGHSARPADGCAAARPDAGRPGAEQGPDRAAGCSWGGPWWEADSPDCTNIMA